MYRIYATALWSNGELEEENLLQNSELTIIRRWLGHKILFSYFASLSDQVIAWIIKTIFSCLLTFIDCAGAQDWVRGSYYHCSYNCKWDWKWKNNKTKKKTKGKKKLRRPMSMGKNTIEISTEITTSVYSISFFSLFPGR